MTEDLDALFDEMLAGPHLQLATEERVKLGQDARRTLARRAQLDLGIHPVTRARLHPDAAPVDDRQAEGLRCGDCAHCFTSGYHRHTYVKCDAVPLTHGPGSDTRRWYPACQAYTAREVSAMPKDDFCGSCGGRISETGECRCS